MTFSLIVAAAIAAVAGISSVPGASASLVANVTAVPLGWSLTLPGQNASVALPGELHLTSGEHVRSAILQVETPAGTGVGPSAIEVKGPSTGSLLWNWPYPFGSASLHPESGGVVSADNGTSVGYLTLPPSNLTGGSALVQNVGGAMSPGYHIQVTLGGVPLFDRNGTPPFLPFAPLSWGTPQDGGNVTSLAAAVATSTTELVVVGDLRGGVSVYDLEPGSNASSLYSTTFAPVGPVYAVAAAQVFPGALPSVLASSGYDLFVLGPTPTGTWGGIVMTTERAANSSLPKATALGGGVVGETPTILLTTVADDLEEATWSATSGWSAPARVLELPSAAGTLSVAQANASTIRVAVGGPFGVSVYDQSNATPDLLGAISLAGSVGAEKVALNSTGDGLLILGTDGSLYSATAPGWQAAALPVPGGWSTASFSQTVGQPDAALLTSRNGSVWQLLDPFGATPQLQLVAGSADLNPGVGAILASIYGTNENDALGSERGQLLGAEYTPSFTASSATRWVPGIQSYLRSATPLPDAEGNLVVLGSVLLSVQGGSCQLTKASVSYNATATQNVSGWISSLAPTGSAPGALNLTLSADSETSGAMHVELVLVVETPVPAPPVPWSTQVQDYLSSNGLLLAGGVAAGGVACLAAGRFLYLRRPHVQPAGAGRAGAVVGPTEPVGPKG